MQFSMTGLAFLLGYIVLVLLLSRLFLNERLSLMKIAGISLTLVGVGLLSWGQK